MSLRNDNSLLSCKFFCSLNPCPSCSAVLELFRDVGYVDLCRTPRKVSYFMDSSGSLRCSHEIRGDLWNTSSRSPLVNHFSSLHLNFLSYETRMLKTNVLNNSLVPRAWQGLWGRSQGQGQNRGDTCRFERGPRRPGLLTGREWCLRCS